MQGEHTVFICQFYLELKFSEPVPQFSLYWSFRNKAKKLITIQAYRIQESEYRMKTATTRGEHLWQVAATSFPRIAVAAVLVPAIIIPMPE